MSKYVITPESLDGFFQTQRQLLISLKAFQKAMRAFDDIEVEDQEVFDDKMDELDAAISDLEWELKYGTSTQEHIDTIFEMSYRATSAVKELSVGII